jgi:uncharacterized DUF497 family protein
LTYHDMSRLTSNAGAPFPINSGQERHNRQALRATYLPTTQLWYIFYTMVEFQYDAKKSRSNLKKHGIDFEQAQVLWEDPNLVTISARSDDEPRSLIIARLNDQFWSAIVTERGNEIRIISARRSRAAEVELYES